MSVASAAALVAGMAAGAVIGTASGANAVDDTEIVTAIAPDESTYAGWHQGYADSEFAHGLTADGLMMTGESQVINGYEDNTDDLSGDDQINLRRTLRNASYQLADGEARFQVALFFDNTADAADGPKFTTLRPSEAGEAGVNEIGTNDLWVSSQAINGEFGKNEPAPLGDLLAAIGPDRKTIGFGVLTTPGSGALVENIYWGDTTYLFRASKAEPKNLMDRDIGLDDTPYAGWHQGAVNSDVPGVHEVTEDGLELDGRSQVINGYRDNSNDLTTTQNVHLPSAVENASYTVTGGQAWFQLGMYFSAGGSDEPQWTTLRPADPAATGGTTELSLDDEWTSSRAVDDIPANSRAPLGELIGTMTDYKVVAFGVFSDTGGQATVSNLTFDGTKYTFADDGVRPTTKRVFEKQIRPDESTYPGWHQGESTADASNYAVGNDGLELMGKAQVIYGYDDTRKGDIPHSGLDRALSEASYTVESGDAWFQVPVAWEDGGFTTLRPADPASQRENAISMDDPWVTSRDIGEIPENAQRPLRELVDALQSMDQERVIGFGVFTDDGQQATVSSIEWDGTTYEFTNRAPNPKTLRATTTAREAVRIELPTVDRDGTPIKEIEVTDPVNGTAKLNKKQTVLTYKPNRNFTGKDRLRYTVIDEHDESGEDRILVRVKKQDAKITGITVKPKKVTPKKRARVTVRVKADGKAATGKVLVRKGGKVYGLKKLNKGRATIKIAKLKRGKHKLTAKYLGNKVTKKDTKKFTVRVVKR